jgi:hypothetical protein
MWKLHIAGEPMLNKKLLKVASGSMQSLHDGIWFTEQRLLGQKNPSYLIYVAKVPKGHGFVETTPGDMIFLRFDDIFSMFHVGRLHYSLVRLFVLSMAMDLSRENITLCVAIVDPNYFRDGVLANPYDMELVKTYLEDFMLKNKRKDYILMLYFPE